MIGLAGLLLTSATGAKARCMPTARPSSAVIRPISYAALSLPVAPTPILGGNSVPPLSRRLVPPSKSEATSSGSARALLQPVELGRDVERRADRDDDAADVQRVHPRLRAREAVVVVGGVGARDPRASPAARSGRARESPRAAVATSVSGPTAAGRRGSATARPTPRRRAAGAQQDHSPVRGTWGAQISRRAGTLRMVARLRHARPRGPGAGARRGAAGHRRAADRQPGGWCAAAGSVW